MDVDVGSDVDLAPFVEYFRHLYNEEAARENILNDRSRTFVSIISIMIGINAFRIADTAQIALHPAGTAIIFSLSIAAAVMFLASFLTCLGALGIRSYERLNNPVIVLKQLQVSNWDMQSFFIGCLGDYHVATGKNKKMNDERSRWLRVTTLLMFFGFVIELGLMVSVGRTLVGGVIP